jgi:hypothetical protein
MTFAMLRAMASGRAGDVITSPDISAPVLMPQATTMAIAKRPMTSARGHWGAERPASVPQVAVHHSTAIRHCIDGRDARRMLRAERSEKEVQNRKVGQRVEQSDERVVRWLSAAWPKKGCERDD